MLLPNGYNGPVVCALYDIDAPQSPDKKQGAIVVAHMQAQGEGATLSIDDEEITDSLDYRRLTGAYNHQNDDADTDYVIVHVLALGDTIPSDAALPSAALLEKGVEDLSPSLIKARTQGKLASHNFDFLLRVISSPVWMAQTWNAHGRDIARAQAHIVTAIVG